MKMDTANFFIEIRNDHLDPEEFISEIVGTILIEDLASNYIQIITDLIRQPSPTLVTTINQPQ